MPADRCNQKTVFFLSGMFAGGWIWDRMRRHLDDDATFHATTEPLCYLSDTIEGLCEEIQPQIDKIQGQVSLVGNSLGSLLGLRLAAGMPRKIDAVVISGSPGFGHFKVNLKVRKSDPYAMKQNLIELICHDNTRAEQADFDRIITSFSERFRNIIRLANQANKTDAEPLLSNVLCPIYAIWGRNDLMTPLERVQEALGRNSIETHVIDNCGHSPMYEQPGAFASTIRRCLF